ncbi:protein moonraker isoform X4 [Oryzias latipes]|uniref:protein moonraker isoform X4 n=1 Tax=Oryzias latipes TaxID=8090 RepID=UPI0005CBCEB4|nr:protein moonraker isoform X4 [Oryzias latipes]
MTTQHVQAGPVNSLGQDNLNRAWVAVNLNVNVGDPAIIRTTNKLLFNEAIPASAINRATRVGPPAPIVIEKLLPRTEEAENGRSSRSSLGFTALSEERLQAAVKLAKKDLRRRRFESHANIGFKPLQEISYFETSDVELLEELAASPSKTKLKVSSPKEKVARPGTKQHISQKYPASSLPRAGQSPPTRDSGLGQKKGDKRTPLSQEIQKLQNELEVYIQKVEELANREENVEEPFEPEEQTKLEMRRQKQAARSAQVIYVLQQQVKEIRRDIENLRADKTWDTKKAIAINKLAAAHRGALRALQVISHQLSDVSHSKVPPHCKELGQLLRQLSLCSAKVEVDQDSAVPGIALDILQKLEVRSINYNPTLDSVLSKQHLHEKRQNHAYSPHRKLPHRSMSPSPAPKGPSMSAAGRPPLKPKRGFHGERRMGPHTSRRTSPTSHQPVRRRDALHVGLRLVAQQRELKKLQGRVKKNAASSKEQRPEKRKSHIPGAGFQQPTVSSRLRVNQLPEKQHSVPWIPTSPHSPPPQRRSPQRGISEPRCLFSPVKPPLSPPKQQVGGGLDTELTLSPTKAKEAQNEALRKAWLDKLTVQRQKELNHFTIEEAERIQRLRSEVISAQTSDKEKTSKERTRPLVKGPQAAGGAERLSEALLEDLSEDTAARAAEADRRFEGLALCGLPASTLESMLLRMEEIQRDEEEVRRRFASITYSDPLYWNREGSQRRVPGSRPASPQPIRFTRPVLKQTSAADIVLEKPLDVGHDFLFESSLTDQASQSEQVPTSSTVTRRPLERSKGTVISVPSSMLRSIRHYQDNYDTFVRSKAHEAPGGFNPWAVAESLADEFLSEVLDDVATEFQDVVEEYAEAVFTSEFLQPIQSPPASTAAVVRQ